MPENDNQKYLGNGLNFPLRTNRRGEIALVTGATDIEQSIRIILETSPGERVMRPNFGCRAKEMVFNALTPETFSILSSHVSDALALWEPRIRVLSVQTGIDDSYPGSMLCEISYEINATHDTRSIIYPFRIEPEPGVEY